MDTGSKQNYSFINLWSLLAFHQITSSLFGHFWESDIKFVVWVRQSTTSEARFHN